MTTTQWTKGDLAMLTERAFLLAIYDEQQYCKCCDVVRCGEGMQYCDACSADIANYLFSVYTQEGAIAWQERNLVDQGLY